jgi:hypothetical protein
MDASGAPESTPNEIKRNRIVAAASAAQIPVDCPILGGRLIR